MRAEPLSPATILAWYLDAGVDETIGDAPVDRYAETATVPVPAASEAPSQVPSQVPSQALSPASSPAPAGAASSRPAASPFGTAPPSTQALESAYALATAATDLDALKAAVAGFDGCALKVTATNLVFGDGNPKARAVFIGEAPGADEDRLGVPFVGASGRLLDKMLASIGLAREDVFISNTVFWRPPGNRTPNAAEVSVCRPFVERMLELIDPDVVVALGGAAASSLLGKADSVGRLRGKWHEVSTPRLSRPIAATVLYHPAYLLRSPGQKRNAWRDLLALKRRLAGT